MQIGAKFICFDEKESITRVARVFGNWKDDYLKIIWNTFRSGTVRSVLL
jgi:hypothetical protein